ncbi:hypothetical protein [Enterococcus rotai]|uniref:hypothetical protein n=1 Tax=Enterococcus rotai TaxID=118060 RepID=UPI0032B4B397
MKVKVERQGKDDEVIECDSFDLVKAVGIINGTETDEQGNKLAGFLVGEKRYFRSLEIVGISIVK